MNNQTVENLHSAENDSNSSFYKNSTKSIISAIAYLIGVKKQIFEMNTNRQCLISMKSLIKTQMRE